jgi:hypothetical protein
MVDYFPVSPNRKFPEPAPEPEAEDVVAKDATMDVVVNVYKGKQDGYSIALRLSFNLPDKA